MSNKLGVDQTRELIAAVTQGYRSLNNILRAGKTPNIFTLARDLGPLSAMVTTASDGADKIPAELLDLTEDEFKNQLGKQLLDLGWEVYQQQVLGAKR